MTEGCRHFALLADARPGELAPEEACALDGHLAACAACRARRADAAALSGLLSEALLAEASRRDLSELSDAVLARIDWESHGPPRGVRAFLGWLRLHPWSAVTAAIPALAALALAVYLGHAWMASPAALVEVSAEGGSPTILETSDGPIVLLGEDEPIGS